MKNAFDVNLPKGRPRRKSPVLVLASQPDGVAGPASALPPEASADPAAPPRQPATANADVPAQPRTPLPAQRELERTVRREGRLAALEKLEHSLRETMSARGHSRSQTERARAQLARSASAASEALHRLSTLERRYEERRRQVDVLMAEIETLKNQRSEVLEVARRLTGLGRPDDPNRSLN
jgi:cell division protein FtsB